MTSITSFDGLRRDYAVFVAAQAPYPCPRCGQPRWRHGSHERWVCWACGGWNQLALVHVRCGRCHTVETLFPPWLLPYESLTVDVLNQVLESVGHAGQSVAHVAQQWDLPPSAIRRRLFRWLPRAPQLRQQVTQHAEQWGMALGWSTWTPPLRTRSADWSGLLMAWQALALVLVTSVLVATLSPGLPQWREWAPEWLPAGVVPRRAHLGRRLVGGRRPP